MRINGWVLTFGLVSIMLLFSVGCRQQTAVTAIAEQETQLSAKAVPSPKDEEIPQEAVPAGGKPSPNISFEKTVYDFGEIGVRQRKQCEFRFKNTGDGLLKIGKIHSSCGCTVPSLSKKEYEPGEKGVLKVMYSASSKPGTIAKRIAVETNDDKNSKVNLKIKAEVIQLVEVTPARLRLSLGKENGGISKILLTSRDGQAFSIKDYIARRGLVDIGIDPNVSDIEFVLEPRFDMSKLKKHRRGGIKFNLTHPRSSLIMLPYQVVEKFQTQPGRIMLTNAEPNESQIKEVLIKNTDKERFEIESISSAKGYAKVISQQPNGNNIKLKVQITPPAAKAKEKHFSDQIRIKIKGDEDLTIRCIGFYRRDIIEGKPDIKSQK